MAHPRFAFLFLVLVVVLTMLVLAWSIQFSLLLIQDFRTTDWRILAGAGERAGTPALYVEWDDGPYRYSPLYAWLLVPLGWVGPRLWTLLHIGAAFAFRNVAVTLILLLAWPFWFDAINGNVLTFVVLTAWWALKGNRPLTVAYFVMTLLMPRPIMIPVLIWILWKRPGYRVMFAGLFAVNAVLVLWTGLGDEWVPVLAAGGDMLSHRWNLGPSAIIGAAWIPIGIVASGLLVRRGWVGLASLAISPYLLPYYYLFALLDLPRLAKVVPWRSLFPTDGPFSRLSALAKRS